MIKHTHVSLSLFLTIHFNAFQLISESRPLWSIHTWMSMKHSLFILFFTASFSHTGRDGSLCAVFWHAEIAM